MKCAIVMFLSIIAPTVGALCSRERGRDLLRRFEQSTAGCEVTNNVECFRTVVDDTGEYKFCYALESGILRRVRIRRLDGGVDIYDYRDGKLESASCSSTNLSSMVVTLFIGDGGNSRSVDRIEFDSVNGKVTGAMRFLDIHGKNIGCPLPSRKPSIDKEYLPSPGMSAKVGPYEWTIVEDKYREGVLSRNGKKILESYFSLGGRYPWIVGVGRERLPMANRKELTEKGISPVNEYGNAYYYFVIDMRNDHVEYIPRDNEDEIEKITGKRYKAYDVRNFWGYFLSKRGHKRLAELEMALKPPAFGNCSGR